MAFSQRRGMYGLNQETVEALQRDMNSVGGDRVRDKHRGSNGKDSSLRSPGRSPALSGSAKSHSASNDDFDDLLASLIWGASLDVDIRPHCLTIQNKEISICHLKKAKAAIPEDDPR
jgi:hypothetical protein